MIEVDGLNTSTSLEVELEPRMPPTSPRFEVDRIIPRLLESDLDIYDIPFWLFVFEFVRMIPKSLIVVLNLDIGMPFVLKSVNGAWSGLGEPVSWILGLV